MDFQINITLDTPDIIVAARLLADAFQNARFKASFAAAQEPATSAGIPKEYLTEDPPIQQPITAKQAESVMTLDKTEPDNNSIAPQPPPVTKVTIEDVRAILAEKTQQDKQPAVKALITKYGAKKLTDIDPACYAQLITEAEAL